MKLDLVKIFSNPFSKKLNKFLISRKFTLLITLLIALFLLISGLFAGSFINSENTSDAFDRQKDLLTVIFFDVGQGDSTLIRTPQGKNILIDGGPDSTVLYKLGKYLSWQDKTIDLMILTHPHADHVTGLTEILHRYEVLEVFTTGALHTTESYLEWLKLIREGGIKVHISRTPEIIYKENGIFLTSLYPLSDISGKTFDNLNDSSLVARLVYGNISFLFTGDLESEKQNEMLEHYALSEIDSNIFKVPHQGASDALNVDFLQAVQPELAIIFVGKNNKYGHPSLRTIKALQRVGAEVKTTMDEGDIIIISDGDRWQKS